MTPLALVILAYVLGATPTSYWLGRFVHGVDLRERGSGNLGATNTFRVLGWRAALPVGVIDMAKGWFPVMAFPLLHPEGSWAWALAYGAAAILGHVASFWVGFRGGKGVATSTGVFLALAPAAVLAGALVWIITLALFRIVSLASLAAVVTVPVVIATGDHPGGALMVWFTVGLAAFVFWAHRSNIRRLLRGEEPRIHRRGGGPPDSHAAPAGQGPAL